MTRRSALIIGAGIGGLAAGIALQRAGWHVRIFERAQRPRELGFALALAPNAMAALQELRLSETLLAEGVVTTSFEIRRADGHVLKRLNIPAGEDASAWRSVVALRTALHGALLEAIGAGALESGSEAVDFTPTQSGVVLTLADLRTVTGDILIGADGVGSVIRKRLHPLEPLPRRSGFCALRGVAYEAAHHLGELGGVGYLGDGFEAGTARASKNAVYWYLSVLARDLPAQAEEPRNVLERYVSKLDDGFRTIVTATKASDMRFDVLFERDPLRVWGAGPVTLLGDAAHPMLPHTAQGAAQALEDAVALGLALSQAGDSRSALRKYERVRSARTARVVQLGRRIARVTTTRNPLIGGLRNTAARLIPQTLIMAAARLARGRDPHRHLR